MVYSQRKRRRYGRRPNRKFSSRVKRVIKGMAETQRIGTAGEIQTANINLTSGSGYSAYGNTLLDCLYREYDIFKPSELEASVKTGSMVNQFKGKEILVTGIRLVLDFDNSFPQCQTPVYFTVLLLKHTDYSGNVQDYLFKENQPEEDTSSSNPSYEYKFPIECNNRDRSRVHTLPLNTDRFQVLHRTSIRLSGPSGLGFSGPTYQSRVAYIPMNQRITMSNVDPEKGGIKPRLTMVMYATNPTQTAEPSTDAQFSCHAHHTIYYKDF